MPGDFPAVAIHGTGGHAKIVKEILDLKGIPVAVFLDENSNIKASHYLGRPVLSRNSVFEAEKIPFDAIVIAEENSVLRRKITQIFKSKKIHLFSAIHPSAIISPSVKMGGGVVICAGAIVNCGTVIGESVIINTKAVVDYDCKISSFARIAPGAILGAKVCLGELSSIGPGATIIENINIGSNSSINAGSVILKNIPDNVTISGITEKSGKSEFN
jgi:sugar O-acyltransferase (sialic acid O-acetyltransferase NeuD family)